MPESKASWCVSLRATPREEAILAGLFLQPASASRSPWISTLPAQSARSRLTDAAPVCASSSLPASTEPPPFCQRMPTPGLAEAGQT